MDSTLIIALVIGLTQVFKMFDLSKRLTPVFAIVMGVLINMAFNAGGVWEQVLVGIIIGLTAVGLFSGSKTVITGK